MITEFNPENKPDPTFGDLLDPAMLILDRGDAQQYLQSYIRFQSDDPKSKTTRSAEEVCKHNLFRYAQLHGEEVLERVKKLFDAKLISNK